MLRSQDSVRHMKGCRVIRRVLDDQECTGTSGGRYGRRALIWSRKYSAFRRVPGGQEGTGKVKTALNAIEERSGQVKGA